MPFNTKPLRTCLFAGIAAATALAWAPPGEARVTRIVIDTTGPVANQPSYEELTGRAWGELDPHRPKNELITDIKRAPRNAHGKIEYIASFRIRKPTDMSLSSGLMWHDVPNRGGNVNLTSDLIAAGDLQLLSGWQGDNAGATRLPANVDCLPTAVPPCTAPVFANHYVKTPVLAGVTGRIFARIINRSGLNSAALNVMGNPIPYFPVDVNSNAGDVMTIVTHETINGKVTVGGTVPNSDWKYCGAGSTFAAPLPVMALPVHVCMKDGFDPAKLYQLAYRVKDPYVLGVGTAAFRDVQSFFRYRANDDYGTENPVRDRIRWAIIRGSSQSGNFTRHFIHLGMNQDERGRIVHEGAWPLIAGRRVANNSRWGQPDGVLELYQMGSEGPQWWAKASDKVRDLPKAGILDRCKKTHTCPKVIETFGGAEVFALKMTMSWVGTSADRDLELPSNVRRYYLPSSTHGGGNGLTTEAPAAAGSVNCPGNNWGRGTLRANPVPALGLVNRMRAALRDWVMLGTPPPPSQWPTLEPLKQHDGRHHDWDDDDDHDGQWKHAGWDRDWDDDDDRDGKRKHRHKRDRKWRPLLVEPTMKAMGFPKGIPGIPESIFKPENFVFPVFDYDWGPRYDHSEASGVPTNAPPPIRHVIKTLVPRVDKDGNELGGVPTVQRDAPLGTYLGWNITAGPGDVGYEGRPFHAGQVCNYVGGMVPFFKTKAQRLAAGDPRRSLEERYATHDGYVAAVTKAANNAYEKGYLLAADRDALILQAANSDVCNQPTDGGKCNP
ncbi:MAG TPA: alpha/beta hydrolase domain-containing protein [Dehalococcoidia bacterium]|nr:alpha/beta hydrolase domain-containing protein [Dehalococcoidia bacterium]